MKNVIIFLLIVFVSFNTHCQTEKKFNYANPFDENSYIVTLKNEKPISKCAKQVIGRFLDEQNVSDMIYSIVEKSISTEKKQNLTGRGGLVDIRFSSTGRVLCIIMYIDKDNLEILNESDLYTLYSNLHKFEMDMSKIDLEYPDNWVQGTEAYWRFNFPLKKRDRPQ